MPELLKLKEAAEIAGVHRNTIVNWIDAGLLKKYRVGVGRGVVKVCKEELLKVCRGE